MVFKTNTQHWSFHLSIILALCGVMVLAYGAIVSSSYLYEVALRIRGSLLAAVIGTDHTLVALHSPAAGYAPGAPQSLFLAGCLLVIGGACVDVWRRLRKGE